MVGNQQLLQQQSTMLASHTKIIQTRKLKHNDNVKANH